MFSSDLTVRLRAAAARGAVRILRAAAIAALAATDCASIHIPVRIEEVDVAPVVPVIDLEEGTRTAGTAAAATAAAATDGGSRTAAAASAAGTAAAREPVVVGAQLQSVCTPGRRFAARQAAAAALHGRRNVAQNEHAAARDAVRAAGGAVAVLSILRIFFVKFDRPPLAAGSLAARSAGAAVAADASASAAAAVRAV